MCLFEFVFREFTGPIIGIREPTPFAFPDSAILKNSLFFLCMERNLETEIKFNPKTFGMWEKNDVLVIFIFTVRVFVRLF